MWTMKLGDTRLAVRARRPYDGGVSFGLTRRQALGVLSAATVAHLTPLRIAWAACDPTPPQTQGPFWLDENPQRSDIRADPSDGTTRPGVPLTLRLRVTRSDAACAPAGGAQVDVWQCDAGGVYSDDANTGEPGGRFLRGYQLADANGAVQFTTIYPGWYPGRTVHVHYRVRGAGGVDFTSQVYFDDTITDQVLANAPYADRGARDTTNADDAIFDASTLLALVPDGTGGWIGTFDVALAGLAACADAATCRAALATALPDPEAADGKARPTARRLARLFARATSGLERAPQASGKKQRRLQAKVRSALARIAAIAAAADDAGTLGVPLAPLVQAADALRATLAAA
jgi:protocatechuate 3,4-dioxygenase beta subunit